MCLLTVHNPEVMKDRKSRVKEGRPCFHGYRTVGVFPCAGAHLRQSGLFVADFVLADGRQLLQRVAVVGERSRQPCKLCPSCRTETEKTTFTKTDTSGDVASHPDL